MITLNPDQCRLLADLVRLHLYHLRKEIHARPEPDYDLRRRVQDAAKLAALLEKGCLLEGVK